MKLLHDKIAVSGKMGAGKSTLSKKFAKKYGYQIVSIGTAIKDLASLVIEKRLDEIYLFLNNLQATEKEKETITSQLMQIDIAPSKELIKESDGHYKKTEYIRKVLQDIAMIMREHFGKGVWVNYLLKKHEGISPIMIDDIRLKVEKDLLEKNGYITIRVDIDKDEQMKRLKKLYGTVDEERLSHPTETDLDSESFFARKNVTKTNPEQVFRYFQNKLTA